MSALSFAMMNNIPGNKLQVMIYLSVLETLDEVQKSLMALKATGLDFDQMSIMGKLPEDTGTLAGIPLSRYTKICGPSVGLGVLYIPEIGEAFVAGSLSSLLLNMIGNKALGSIEGGLQGILAGYGVEMKTSLRYISHLKKGKYLVIIKGNALELKLVKEALNKIGITTIKSDSLRIKSI